MYALVGGVCGVGFGGGFGRDPEREVVGEGGGYALGGANGAAGEDEGVAGVA